MFNTKVRLEELKYTFYAIIYKKHTYMYKDKLHIFYTREKLISGLFSWREIRSGKKYIIGIKTYYDNQLFISQ